MKFTPGEFVKPEKKYYVTIQRKFDKCETGRSRKLCKRATTKAQLEKEEESPDKYCK